MRNILFFVHLVACFDPERIEYCKIRCTHNYQVSSGCYCKITVPGREEITDNMVEFRKLVLQVHNRLRNNLARGDEEEKNYPQAQDMHVLNYDLELEYLARCYLTSSRYTEDLDPCTATSFCTPYPASQNIYEGSTKNTSLEWVEGAVKEWYKEMNNVPFGHRKQLIGRFKQVNASRFTQVIWASMMRLGCTRVWLEKMNKLVLLCNYAGPKSMCTANIVDMPVYKAGPYCKRCSKIEKCNIQWQNGLYEALCGVLRPVETMSPKEIGRGVEKGVPKDTDETRKVMEQYSKEEYEDRFVDSFFGFEDVANYKHVDRMVVVVLVVKLINL